MQAYESRPMPVLRHPPLPPPPAGGNRTQYSRTPPPQLLMQGYDGRRGRGAAGVPEATGNTPPPRSTSRGRRPMAADQYAMEPVNRPRRPRPPPGERRARDPSRGVDAGGERRARDPSRGVDAGLRARSECRGGQKAGAGSGASANAQPSDPAAQGSSWNDWWSNLREVVTTGKYAAAANSAEQAPSSLPASAPAAEGSDHCAQRTDGSVTSGASGATDDSGVWGVWTKFRNQIAVATGAKADDDDSDPEEVDKALREHYKRKGGPLPNFLEERPRERKLPMDDEALGDLGSGHSTVDGSRPRPGAPGAPGAREYHQGGAIPPQSEVGGHRQRGPPPSSGHGDEQYGREQHERCYQSPPAGPGYSSPYAQHYAAYGAQPMPPQPMPPASQYNQVAALPPTTYGYQLPPQQHQQHAYYQHQHQNHQQMYTGKQQKPMSEQYDMYAQPPPPKQLYGQQPRDMRGHYPQHGMPMNAGGPGHGGSRY